MKISISLAQLNLHFGDIPANLQKALSIAKNQKPQSLLLFPELWSSSYDLENTPAIANSNQMVIDEMSKMAKQQEIFIGGSLLENREGEIYNTFSIIAPDGKIAAKYNKIHLFRLMAEHRWMKPGTELITKDFEWGRAGLAICYDLRFPELFRRYALMGCHVIFIVAEWPLRRIQHWRTLLQARAIENQLYIAAVNCVGSIGNAEYGGCSMIINPWGEILSEASQSDEEVISSEIDLEMVKTVREKIPVFKDRRSDIYGD